MFGNCCPVKLEIFAGLKVVWRRMAADVSGGSRDASLSMTAGVALAEYTGPFGRLRAGSSLGVFRFSRRTPLPQDDNQKDLRAAGFSRAGAPAPHLMR